MRRAVIGILLLLTFWSRSALTQCEPSQAVRKILNQLGHLEGGGLTEAEEKTKRLSILQQGLAKYRENYFLLSARMLAEPDREAEIHWAEALQREHPDRPEYAILRATALVTRDTPEAIGMLEALKASGPAGPQAFLQLSQIHAFNKFKDATQLQSDIKGFLQECPASLDPEALNLVFRNGTTEQILRMSAAVHKRLRNMKLPFLQSTWVAVWKMEFKVRSKDEQPLLRAEISQDLARFQHLSPMADLDSLMLLHSGYELLNNQAEMDKVDDRVLDEYATSPEAMQVAEQRWNRDHPILLNDSEASFRASLADVTRWQKRWPNNSFIVSKRLDALTELGDTTPDQIAEAGDELLAAIEKNPNNYYVPIFYNQLAAAFVKYKIRLDQVLGLEEKSYRPIRKREEACLKDDQNVEETLEICKQRVTYIKLRHFKVLLDYYELSTRPNEAREIDQELKTLDAPSTYRPYLLSLRGQAAVIEGRKLDALLLYHAALDGAATESDVVRSSFKEKVDSLWKALGGTPEGYGLFVQSERSTSAAVDVWVPPKKPMPEFSLQDLDGKTWKLADWGGKTLLINVWATWCLPCREELPQVQELYDMWKDRKDVALLTLNIDEDATKISPFVQRNKFTFPILVARDFVATVIDGGIPQTWIVNSMGKLVCIMNKSTGRWRELVAAKMEEVQKEAN